VDALLHFAASPWLFALVAAPGLWLAHALYGLPGVPEGFGRPRGAGARRPILALTYALAWLLLALWLVSPSLRLRSETWHPPAVLLVVDDGPGYAALGARDSALRAAEAARRHYEARGFKVVQASWVSLRESARAPFASVPNLQAVLLWSDGRTPPDSLPAFTARVFPVVPTLATREVQGESAFVAVDEDGGVGDRLVVRWRALGQRVDARAEVRVDRRVVWNGALAHPAEVPPGAEVTTSVTIPALPRATEVRLLVRPLRPDDNTLGRNDTLALYDAGSARVTQRLVRPLATLDERALADALREEPSFSVRTARADEVDAGLSAGGAGMVTWRRAGRAPHAVDGPLVVYRLAEQAEDGDYGFSPDARVARAAGGEAFLPAGVVRLADLGVREGEASASFALPGTRADREPLAWAEEGGRRGLLVWREKATGVIGAALPPLWSARFQAEGADRGATRRVRAEAASAWLRGVALWTLSLHRAARASRVDERDPVPSRAYARAGIDREALVRLAARHDGALLTLSGAEDGWPRLPDGQVRERAVRALVFTPPAVTALALALLFAAVWAWRKRSRLD